MDKLLTWLSINLFLILPVLFGLKWADLQMTLICCFIDICLSNTTLMLRAADLGTIQESSTLNSTANNILEKRDDDMSRIYIISF